MYLVARPSLLFQVTVDAECMRWILKFEQWSPLLARWTATSKVHRDVTCGLWKRCWSLLRIPSYVLDVQIVSQQELQLLQQYSVTSCYTISVLCKLLHTVFIHLPQLAPLTIHLPSHTDVHQCDVCLLHGQNCEEQMHEQQLRIETGQTPSPEVPAEVEWNVHLCYVLAVGTFPQYVGLCVQLLQAALFASEPWQSERVFTPTSGAANLTGDIHCILCFSKSTTVGYSNIQDWWCISRLIPQHYTLKAIMGWHYTPLLLQNDFTLPG